MENNVARTVTEVAARDSLLLVPVTRESLVVRGGVSASPVALLLALATGGRTL